MLLIICSYNKLFQNPLETIFFVGDESGEKTEEEKEEEDNEKEKGEESGESTDLTVESGEKVLSCTCYASFELV